MSSTGLRTRRTAQERSAEILASARALAREDGLSAVTLRAVAQRAGVAPGLVAHYQPSMEALVAAVFTDIVEAEIADLTAIIAGIEPPEQRASALFSTLLDGSRHDVTLVWVEAWALGRRNASLERAIEHQMKAWHELVVALIEDGCSGGVFRTADPGLVAWQILGMIDGLAAHALVRRTDLRTFREQLTRAAEVLLGADPGSLASGS
jgi:AcrR family transcriptional regulator